MFAAYTASAKHGTEERNESPQIRSFFISHPILSHPIRDGGDDGDGVLDTAATIRIIVTTVTHRHAVLKLALRQSFFRRVCVQARNQSDTH